MPIFFNLEEKIICRRNYFSQSGPNVSILKMTSLRFNVHSVDYNFLLCLPLPIIKWIVENICICEEQYVGGNTVMLVW